MTQTLSLISNQRLLLAKGSWKSLRPFPSRSLFKRIGKNIDYFIQKSHFMAKTQDLKQMVSTSCLIMMRNK